MTLVIRHEPIAIVIDEDSIRYLGQSMASWKISHGTFKYKTSTTCHEVWCIEDRVKRMYIRTPDGTVRCDTLGGISLKIRYYKTYRRIIVYCDYGKDAEVEINGTASLLKIQAVSPAGIIEEVFRYVGLI